MLQNDIPKEQVLHFAEKLRELVTFDYEDDRNLIKKGLLLYRQGSVYNVKYNGKLIEGRVQDVTPVDVTLDLDFLEMSSCDCPAADFCRHRMAVFFYVYASVDRVGSLLEEWKEGTKAKKSTIPPLAVRKLMETKQEYTENSFQTWIPFFNKEYTKFTVGYPEKSQYYFAAIYHTFFQALKRKAPFPSELKKLFHIHAALFCIQKITEHIDELGLKEYQIDMFVKPYFHNFLDVIFDSSSQLNQVSLPFSMDSLIEDGLDWVRKSLLSHSWFQYERLQMYRLMWATLLNRKQWIKAEEQALIQHEEKYKSTIEEIVAFSHLKYLQKDDRTAVDLLEKVGGHAVIYCFWWIGDLSSSKEWDRIRIWTEYAISHITSYVFRIPGYEGRRYVTRLYLNHLLPFAENVDDTYYLASMKQLLPYSYNEYTEYLLDTEDYRTWVELQMLVGYDLDECDRYAIKKIEENDRLALLPFYHQAIASAIEQKNRSSYKKAVKYLKKIRTHYRRLKQEDIWNAYIIKLASSNKRLRAFQEELTRASLIVKK